MNNQPTKEEINRKLAEFIGNKIAIPSNLSELSERQLRDYLPYTYSLDKLSCVWSELGFTSFKCEKRPMGVFQKERWRFTLFIQDKKYRHVGETLLESAYIATYYAVMEDEKNG